MKFLSLLLAGLAPASLLAQQIDAHGHLHLGAHAEGPLLTLIVHGDTLKPESAVTRGSATTLHYAGGLTAVVRTTARGTYTRYELTAGDTSADAVIWGPYTTDISDTIGNEVGIVRNADVAIGLQCLNLKTTGGKLENEEGAVFDRGTTATATANGASLQAFSINRARDRKITVWGRWPEVPLKAIPDGGLQGSAIALFISKPREVRAVLTQITNTEKLPDDKEKWTPEEGRPYLITTFSESNIDTFLAYAKRMRLAGVYHEELFETWGHFVIRKDLFPHGIAGFKACVDKAHAMGLRLGFHVLSNFITTNDAYVTPVPDRHLMTAGGDALTGAIDPQATDIAVGNTFYFQLKSDLNSVRIDDEIVQYTAIAGNHLTGCVRGAFGTKAAAHAAGTKIDRLIDHPYKVFFPDWELQHRIAANIASFIKETGADQMDFDGHEGTYATGMGDLSFETFADEVFRGAGHHVTFGSSRSNHYFWHINDYLNWGEPWYGGFRESQAASRFANQPFLADNYMPPMLGWFLITARTAPEDVDWMLARAAGYGAGYALVLRSAALSNPHLEEIVGKFRDWDEVRNRQLLNEAQRAWLKDPSTEASLVQRDGQWYLERFHDADYTFTARALQPGQPTDTVWSFDNAVAGVSPRLTYKADAPVETPTWSFDDKEGSTAGAHRLTFDARPVGAGPVLVHVGLRLYDGRQPLDGKPSPAPLCSVTPVNLRCEYLVNPEGIDESFPRLGWTFDATDTTAHGQRQTAYQVIVTEGDPAGAGDGITVWNSGWVTSTNFQQIMYTGAALTSDRTYTWKVRVKDEAGRISAWSQRAHWSTGLFHRSEWTARWIGTGETLDPKAEDCNVSNPWLRKTVELTSQPARAMMFVASVGYHELYVNGQKIGDGVLAPAVTDHTKRARYIVYDIARYLHPGANVVALWLGAPWSIYKPYATDDKPRAPVVIAQADVYDGPAKIRIQTDATWLTHPSPNRLLGNWSFGRMGGELIDERLEDPRWNQPGADTTGWKHAVEYMPRLMLTAQMTNPNKLSDEIHPKSITARPNGDYRIDMGVNFAGWTEIRLKGDPNQRIDIQFSERENEDMTFGIHSAYILDKSGLGTFHNRFNYSSGRWITIKGAKAVSDIKGWVVHTAYDNAASFECSDSLQNWIFNKVRWNFENLSLGGYVVDCPQRERLGYGGDAHATSESGVLNYDLRAFYTKWMQDWRDGQGNRQMDPTNYGGPADDGILPHTAPTYDGGGGPPWGGIVVTLPWNFYQLTGDLRILDRNFDMIKNWLSFLDSHTRNDLMERFGGDWDFLGDWLWPHAGAEGMNNGKPQNICFNNCYRVFNLRTAAKIAVVLHHPKEAEIWTAEADASSAAINANYYHPGDHSYSDSSMDNLAAALIAGVPAETERAAVMQRLADEILINQHGHIHAGITAGALLFKFLRAEGRDDLIYSMTSQTGYPGWGYMKTQGATSLWEAWEGPIPGHSLLHSSYLYPGAWYIDGIGGIRRDTAQPGFQHFIVRAPRLTETQLRWARTTYEAPTGTIKTAWEWQNGRLELEVTVPPGTTATVILPDAIHEVTAGRYRYTTGAWPAR
ncbi:MAG TPA: family 78 glycoside hydrolase catalytic domain [Dinghuibacter sp.]|uniref:family 78 glycoside hydrolase catalytic domain n=1 Tax=Dinghuibacter sp. TaxID=2024697 RepID=UPI002D1AC136|nr:family 78 glycoside hydrolase catalytic domain [Dinghuibacter sp.]HTJ11958.1 family 78 glycoside hydrolase catalytic domain [Dinghuibacter sp.]